MIKQVEVNVDYILMLVEQFLKLKGSGKDREVRASIDRAVAASPSLRNKKDLIEQFVETISITAKVDSAWVAFIAARRTEELNQIIVEEGLDAEATRSFMDNSFRDGGIPASGAAITKVLPALSRFSADDAHAIKKRTVLERLNAFFERYFGLANGRSDDD